MANETVILGIDPGTTIMGFGLIRVQKGTMEFLHMHELHLHKFSNHYLKLQKIFERTLDIIESYHPDEVAIEAPFFGKNVQSMLKLGRAQGVAMAAALTRNLPIVEYTPKKIKMAILAIFDNEMNFKKHSAPFKFEGESIEYSLGLIVEDERVIIPYSTWDRTTKIAVYDKNLINERIKYPLE